MHACQASYHGVRDYTLTHATAAAVVDALPWQHASVRQHRVSLTTA